VPGDPASGELPADSLLALFARHVPLPYIHAPSRNFRFETVDICSDKIRTHDWFVQNGLSTARQSNPQEVLDDPDTWRFPLIAKSTRERI
jgi:hypothetical protein